MNTRIRKVGNRRKVRDTRGKRRRNGGCEFVRTTIRGRGGDLDGRWRGGGGGGSGGEGRGGGGAGEGGGGAGRGRRGGEGGRGRREVLGRRGGRKVERRRRRESGTECLTKFEKGFEMKAIEKHQRGTVNRENIEDGEYSQIIIGVEGYRGLGDVGV